jgi:cytochrome c oxidase assembly factor CtaG
MGGMQNGMMGGGMGMSNMQGNQMAMQNQPARGRIQWVSNAALNAVATESTVGPDGKANGPFKTYIKDMVVVLVLTPVLLVLALTGVLADLGFVIGMGLETIIRAWTAKF